MKTGKLINVIMIISILFLYACGGGGGGSSENVVNEGNNNPDSSGLTIEQAQDVLYAAYAGIGYNKAADVTDNEGLYNVMFNDLNSLAGNFINELLWDQFIEQFEVNPLLLFGELLSQGGKTFQYKTPQAGISSAEVNVKVTNVTGIFPPTSDFSCDFHAKLKVQFNSNGYIYNYVTYKGSAIDFEADIVGSIKTVINGGSKEYRPSLNSINIYAHNTLSAAHTGYSVQYKEWNISYAAKDDTINIYIVPNIGDLVDLTEYNLDVRLYSFKGDFDILKDAVISPYYFDMKYGQLDARQYNFNGLGLGMYIALGGEVSVPSLGGTTVKVSCPGTEILNGNYMDLIAQMQVGQVNFSDFISRTDDGLWTTGKITIALKNGNTIEAAIKADGSSTLSPGNISVPAWQDSLDPLLP